jgi:hypothetical protein
MDWVCLGRLPLCWDVLPALSPHPHHGLPATWLTSSLAEIPFPCWVLTKIHFPHICLCLPPASTPPPSSCCRGPWQLICILAAHSTSPSPVSLQHNGCPSLPLAWCVHSWPSYRGALNCQVRQLHRLSPSSLNVSGLALSPAPCHVRSVQSEAFGLCLVALGHEKLDIC